MANLDSRSKRASSVGLLLPFVLTPVLPDGTLSAGDRQHIAFTYSGILAGAQAALGFVLDLNTRLAVYLRDFYSNPDLDLTTGIQRYLSSLSGEWTARFQRLIQDATDAMS